VGGAEACVRVYIIARSISRPVRERLQRGPFSARVLAAFEHACNLVTTDGDVVALVPPRAGDGPLNIVVNGMSKGFATVEPGMPARLGGGRLQVGGLEVALDRAVVWEPCPDWKSLRAYRDAFIDRLPLLEALALQHAPERSLLALTSSRANGSSHPAEVGVSDGLFAAAQEAAESLQAGWEGDPARLQAGAVQLAGLGGGLTPAGDDFLTGVMLWGWLTHSAPRPLCRLLVEAAAPRTTTLSAAFLRAAARGECSAAWHTLLMALSCGSDKEIAGTVQDVLTHGATSGADALAGFLWAGLHPAA